MNQNLTEIVRQLQEPNPYPAGTTEHHIFESMRHDTSSNKEDLTYHVRQIQLTGTIKDEDDFAF